jgi:hypothetical protein
VRTAIAAVAYGALTLWTAFWVVVGGVVGCYEGCPNEGEWWDRSDAWQWDAIALLGLVSAVVGLAALASMFWYWRVGVALVIAHLAVLAVAGSLMGQNPDLGSRPVVVSYVLVVGAAVALVQLRRPSRGGVRGTREGPFA